MKKVTLIIGLLVAASVLFAQDKREARELKIEEHKERLNLTEKQSEDLKALRESLKPEMEALRKDQSKSRSEKMRAHADIIEKREAEVAKILTEEQLTELDAIKEEMKAQAKDKRGKRGPRRN